jgi:hypothetical protein
MRSFRSIVPSAQRQNKYFPRSQSLFLTSFRLLLNRRGHTARVSYVQMTYRLSEFTCNPLALPSARATVGAYGLEAGGSGFIPKGESKQYPQLSTSTDR